MRASVGANSAKKVSQTSSSNKVGVKSALTAVQNKGVSAMTLKSVEVNVNKLWQNLFAEKHWQRNERICKVCTKVVQKAKEETSEYLDAQGHLYWLKPYITRWMRFRRGRNHSINGV